MLDMRLLAISSLYISWHQGIKLYPLLQPLHPYISTSPSLMVNRWLLCCLHLEGKQHREKTTSSLSFSLEQQDPGQPFVSDLYRYLSESDSRKPEVIICNMYLSISLIYLDRYTYTSNTFTMLLYYLQRNCTFMQMSWIGGPCQGLNFWDLCNSLRRNQRNEKLWVHKEIVYIVTS